MTSPLLVRRLRSSGIVHPIFTAQLSALHGIPLPLACAILMQESGGGINEFGHDPTIFIGAGAVTKAKYLAYAKLRDRTAECQGVGPMQLTSSGLQKQADQLGGCWQPRWNIAVGLHYLAEVLDQHPGNAAAGIAAYNGSGPAAERYAQHVLILAAHYKEALA